ncbi:hypothetical protein Syn7502_02057 [Synechococcus sp. PCC 7502]|uniref:hypothetical protein n=1 Tax=Synechococcus sp. PCC 7502 TaxID=1173263 RepID=UPI00029FFC0A|nr:hypothetical protein [Synechococcus sp. PCC 7502]AFY74079.1 hypothetical protein Syn7502_02057 [Synechococcus sp. PCC 7502]
MDDEKEITTRKVTSNPITPVDGYRVTEQTTSRARSDNSATGLVIAVLLILATGVGAGLYYLNNRPSSTIVLPGATNIIKENKSTVIERNNTTTKDATPQTTPNVEVNIPAQPAPKVEVNVPPPTVIVPKVDVNVPSTTTTTTPNFVVPPTKTTNGQ